MDIILVMAVVAAIGLGVFLIWAGTVFLPRHPRKSGFLGSIVQGLIITPFMAVGGVCAFFLFAHFFGVQSVGLLDVAGLQDILAMVGGAAALGGIPLGILGYFSSKMSA